MFEAEQIERFQSKQVRKIFILPEDEPFYLEYLDTALDGLMSPEVALESRSEFAAQALATEADNIEHNFDSEVGFRGAADRIRKIVDFMAVEAAALRGVLSSAGISVDNSSHSSAVASLSSAVAARAGIVDRAELVAMSLAALVHDIGIARLAMDPVLPPDRLSPPQLKRWRKHPEEAVNWIAGKKHITPRILRLVADHHEIGEGLGFPDQKWLTKLPMSSQIFNLCDAFDHFCSAQNSEAASAFEPFVEANQNSFDLRHLEILEKLLKS